MYEDDKSIILAKSKHFAFRIAKMVGYLQGKGRQGFGNIFNQVLRSGTSVMANISESHYAQSPADFVSKLAIALKEAHETRGWLQFFYHIKMLNDKEFASISNDCSEIIAILVSSIKTTKRNYNLE